MVINPADVPILARTDLLSHSLGRRWIEAGIRRELAAGPRTIPDLAAVVCIPARHSGFPDLTGDTWVSLLPQDIHPILIRLIQHGHITREQSPHGHTYKLTTNPNTPDKQHNTQQPPP